VRHRKRCTISYYRPVTQLISAHFRFNAAQTPHVSVLILWTSRKKRTITTLHICWH